jgi:hypothetical protein
VRPTSVTFDVSHSALPLVEFQLSACRRSTGWTRPTLRNEHFARTPGRFEDLAVSESYAIIGEWRPAAANIWPSWRMNLLT